MWCLDKVAILLFGLNAFLSAHAATVVKTKDINETRHFVAVTDEISSECDCGDFGICHFDNGRKKCTCTPSTAELDGKCIECDCGTHVSYCYFRSDGTQVCNCNYGYIEVNGKCTECDCADGLCIFELGRKKCICSPNTIQIDGKCVAIESSTSVATDTSRLMTTILSTTVTAIESSTTVATDTSRLMTTILSTTVKDCSCGENSKSCSYNALGEKQCNCSSGYAENHGYCEECNRGPYGSCSFKYGIKRCNCKSFTVEKYGLCVVMESTTEEMTTTEMTSTLPPTTRACYCGDNTKSCQYNWMDEKICDCYPGYAVKDEYCYECNCGPYGVCKFVNDQKKCSCAPFAVEMNGVCVDVSTSSSKGTTDSIITSTMVFSTVQECDCGPRGNCIFEYGQKKCICDPFTSEKDGKCVDCYCGENSKSCHFNRNGVKVCNCTYGYAQVDGFCQECNCGRNAQSCFYRKNGTKVCDCYFGYIQKNGYCSAICTENKCVHGKCEVMRNGFKCRCNEGFTGARCEEKIQTKSNKINLWMAMQFTITFAIFLLLAGMFCFMARMLNKRSKK